LEPEQVAALLTAAKGTQWPAPFALLGLRRGEVLGLAWEPIDLDAAKLTVERNMVTLSRGDMTWGTPKTRAGRRTRDLDTRLVAVLRAHRKRQAEAALAAGPDWAGTFTDDQRNVVTLIFTDEAGRPWPGHRLNAGLKRLAAEAGLGHVHPHLLRHFAASLMMDHGMNPAAWAPSSVTRPLP
jgi:integrase